MHTYITTLRGRSRRRRRAHEFEKEKWRRDMGSVGGKKEMEEMMYVCMF